MLSKKYQVIKQCLTKVSQIGFVHKKLVVLSQMYVDIDKGFRFSYISDENGETEFLTTLGKYFKENFVFFDVGAHIGTYTDQVLKYSKSYQGHLFDVTKTTFEKCVERHGKNQNLVINNAALSDYVGEVEYRAYPGDPTRNGISGVGPEAHFAYELHKADCWTGDHYCEQRGIKHINLLKVDAEGYDLHVLKGFDKMLASGAVDVLQFEYNVKHSETRCMLGDFYNYLTAKGYIVGPLRPEGVMFRDFDFMMNDFKSGPNYVACLPRFRDLLSKF